MIPKIEQTFSPYDVVNFDQFVWSFKETSLGFEAKAVVTLTAEGKFSAKAIGQTKLEAVSKVLMALSKEVENK